MANAMAVVVFPTPEIPVKRYACGTFSLAMTLPKKRFARS
jgi:hypothetical protein